MSRPPKPPSGVLAELGQRVKTARTARRMRQVDLADAMGVCRVYVSYIETGRRNITVGTLVILARALGCDPAALVRGLHRAAGR